MTASLLTEGWLDMKVRNDKWYGDHEREREREEQGSGGWIVKQDDVPILTG